MASCVQDLMKKLLKDPDLDDSTQMDECVLEFLGRAGFSAVHSQFKTERLARSANDDSALESTREIEQHLLNGDIDSAIRFIVSRKPELLDDNPDVLFILLKQQFVELIRSKEADAALVFAQDYLSEKAVNNTQVLEDLEKICGLMAFENPESSMFAEYMKPYQRIRVLNAVNNLWLLSELGKGDSDFDLVFKFIEWAQSVLQERNIPFPKLADYAADEGHREDS
ncbi:Glucose-induced degradation protein 8 homolog [Trichuris trichiura]|uniref:Glucose-induced degradation protein 8 homolog n=1 Tax=Trichuris trichiura TaxID=36087 RepID=A0A077YXY0_TRITR|nr:Glucose-induced degradation protein 8 homolog [Trichuris trichiura]